MTLGLSAVGGGPAVAAFPGENGLIAFARDLGGNGEIYVMNADGTSQTRLTTDPAFDSEPAWSQDGTHIAFSSGRDGNSEIYIMNADGTDQTRLTTNAAYDAEPAWSPDGTRIAFNSYRDGNAEIYVMDADGAGQTRLTTNTAFDTEPAWSPDGTRIAFASDGEGNEIYVMNADGTGQTRLTTNTAFDSGPAWSPDGTRIAFNSYRDGYPAIYVMNADGSGQAPLTTNSTGDLEPAWSPDGTRIAFDSGRDGNTEIYVMNADGTGQTRLTTETAHDFGPDWQPVPSRDSGTVEATVTMAASAVCLELSTAAIDFGTRLFGEVGAPASPLIGVTNCSGIGEVILARGTDATGPGGAAWSLATSGACQVGTLGTDAFRLRLESQAVPDVFVDLGTQNATLQALAAGATADHEARMDTPCPGSTGAGAVMSLQIVFTAIEEAAP
ncbi:MAG: hypothetical protein EPO36_12355 [Chloroflexota bacterium]|nr:MAG: hypothetical protein EPO36_12355 [Chloroflexota bacterium]